MSINYKVFCCLSVFFIALFGTKALLVVLLFLLVPLVVDLVEK